MLALLLVVVWLTVSGANYPSQLLQSLFDSGYLWLAGLAAQWGLPWYLSGPLLDGVYTTVARVVAVMLPPMAIFSHSLLSWRMWGICPGLPSSWTVDWPGAAPAASRPSPCAWVWAATPPG